MVSYSQVQTNYICDAELTKSLFYNSFLNYHDKRLDEKTFKAFHINLMIESTLTAF